MTDKQALDALRVTACKKPCDAYYFARDVDKGPHPDTLRAVIEAGPGDTHYARYYAAEVMPLGSIETPDNTFLDALRTAACQSPYYALGFALLVDRGPHPETRAAVLKSAHYALLYATEVEPLAQE